MGPRVKTQFKSDL